MDLPALIRFFDDYGYLHLPGALRSEIGWIIEEFERVWANGPRNGFDKKGLPVNAVIPFVDQSAKLCTLLDHPALEPTLDGLIGKDYNYLSSDGRAYAGDTSWHADGSWTEPALFLKVAFYLDPLTRDSGSLRVIPGSHRIADRFSAATRKAGMSEREYGIPMSAIPCIALETQPGDVVIFNHNTMHASFGGGQRRRMFTMNLGRRADTSDLEERLRQYLANHLPRWSERTHGEIMLATATPGRLRHLEQVIAHEGHLPGLRRQKVEEAAAAKAATLVGVAG